VSPLGRWPRTLLAIHGAKCPEVASRCNEPFQAPPAAIFVARKRELGRHLPSAFPAARFPPAEGRSLKRLQYGDEVALGTESRLKKIRPVESRAPSISFGTIALPCGPIRRLPPIAAIALISMPQILRRLRCPRSALTLSFTYRVGCGTPFTG